MVTRNLRTEALDATGLRQEFRALFERQSAYHQELIASIEVLENLARRLADIEAAINEVHGRAQ